MGGIPGGPLKLTVPQALVKLFTYALEPSGATVKQAHIGGIQVLSPCMDDVDHVSFVPTTQLEALPLIHALDLWNCCERNPKRHEGQLPLPSRWTERIASFLLVNKDSAKYVLLTLFLAPNPEDVAPDLEQMLQLSHYCIEDLADAMDIMNADPTVHWDDLIPAMVRARPLR